MRAFFKYLLAVLAVLVLIPGVGMLGTSLLIGNVDAVTGTAELVLGNDQARQALGEAFTDHLIQNANPQDVASLKKSREQLATAAAQGLSDESTAILAELRKGYSAFIHDSSATVDFAPMLQGIQSRMHAVNARIPAQADVSNATINLSSNSAGGLVLVVFTLGVSWFMLVLGAVMLVGVAVLSGARGFRRALIPGVCLAVVGLWWLLSGATLPSGISSAFDNPNTAAVAKSVADVVSHQFLVLGGCALVLGVVLILLAVLIRPGAKAPSQAAPGVA